MINTIVLAVLATTLTSYTPYWHAIVASSDRSNILARRVLGRREGWGAMGEGERSGWSGQQFDLFIAVECKSVGSGGRGKRTICLLFITFWLPPRSAFQVIFQSQSLLSMEDTQRKRGNYLSIGKLLPFRRTTSAHLSLARWRRQWTSCAIHHR